MARAASNNRPIRRPSFSLAYETGASGGLGSSTAEPAQCAPLMLEYMTCARACHVRARFGMARIWDRTENEVQEQPSNRSHDMGTNNECTLTSTSQSWPGSGSESRENQRGVWGILYFMIGVARCCPLLWSWSSHLAPTPNRERFERGWHTAQQRPRLRFTSW